jgi:hypothetical protein
MSMIDDPSPQRSALAGLLTKLIRGGANPWGSGPIAPPGAGVGAYPAAPPVGQGMTDMTAAGPWGAGIPTNSGGGDVPVPQARPQVQLPDTAPLPQERPQRSALETMPIPQSRPEDAARMPTDTPPPKPIWAGADDPWPTATQWAKLGPQDRQSFIQFSVMPNRPPAKKKRTINKL